MSHHHCHDEHEHGHGSGGGHAHIQQIPTLTSQTLYTKIDLPKVSALNIRNNQEQMPKLFKNSETKYQIRPIFQSDCDNQLIVKIPFIDNIKLYSVILRTNGNADNCPRHIKLFKNNDKLDFDNIEGSKPTHQFEHPLVGYIEDTDYNSSNNDDDTAAQVEDDDQTFVEHHLPRTQFTNVTQLTIYFQDNWAQDDDEPLKLYSLEFRGEFKHLNRAPIVTTYESAANPADHKNLLAQEESKNSSSFD